MYSDGFSFSPLLPLLLPTSHVSCQVVPFEPSLFSFILDIRGDGFLIHYVWHRFVF